MIISWCEPIIYFFSVRYKNIEYKTQLLFFPIILYQFFKSLKRKMIKKKKSVLFLTPKMFYFKLSLINYYAIIYFNCSNIFNSDEVYCLYKKTICTGIFFKYNISLIFFLTKNFKIDIFVYFCKMKGTPASY